MELRQLKYFLAVAEELSFTKAAERLNVSQPPLSLQVANLEEELGTRLFERTSRRVELSESGKALLPHARAILRSIQDARLNVTRVAQGIEGRLHVGLTGSHFLGPFPRFIHEFRKARPGVDLVLHEMAPIDQLAALRGARLDLCFERGTLPHEDLQAQLLWRDKAVVAMPKAHRLSSRKSVHLRELSREDFVLLRSGSSTFERSVHDACLAAGFEPRVIQEVLEVPAVLNLVAAGLGVSVVPQSLARLREGEVDFCSLTLPKDGPVISADVHLICRPDESKPVVLEFMRALRAWAVDRDAFSPPGAI